MKYTRLVVEFILVKKYWLAVVYSKKYPNAILTLDSAFYYYKLTDYIPNKVHLSIGRHADQ